MESALTLIPDYHVTHIITPCMQLPVCGFATPTTRLGKQCRVRQLQPHRPRVLRLIAPTCTVHAQLRLCTIAVHTGCGVLGSHRLRTCILAGRQQDMLLMRGHWQLADMYLCIARVPSLAKVPYPPHPYGGLLSVLQCPAFP
jgi:hypothetical protein